MGLAKRAPKCKVIAMFNQKGGVGKSTSTIQLAAALARLEKKVLVIDADSQGTVTKNLGFRNLSVDDITLTKTLQMFGQKDENGVFHPFHIYSMKQAIEEGFILDVLQNYMTYKMYYKITKIIDDDPELDTTQGSKAILNYETLHPHNISQKTTIMLEHFMNITRHKLGGKAKAMLVTPSRLHAVRYVQEFKKQIIEKGYLMPHGDILMRLISN